jgi:hypothetical protein
MKVCRIHEGDATLRPEVQTDGVEWQPGRSPSSTTPDAAHGSTATVAVSADEVLPRWRELTGTVTIGGERVAEPSTAGSRFGLGEMLAHASASEPLVRANCSASALSPPAAAWRSAAGSSTATPSNSTWLASAASPTRSHESRQAPPWTPTHKEQQ